MNRKERIRWFGWWQRAKVSPLCPLILELKRLVPFPIRVVWNVLVSPKASFFCLAGVLGKNFDARSTWEEKMNISWQMFPFSYSRGVNWPYLATCGKVRVLWQLLFSFFGISWVLPSLVRDFVRMMWFLCRKEMKKKLGNNPFVLFLDNLNGEK